MNPILQDVDDYINNQAQAIALLKQQADLLASVSVFDGLELTPWLLAAGTAANTGATGNTAVSTQSQPGTNCANFKIAPNGPYADSYWYKKLGAIPEKNTFKYEVSLMLPTVADANASQALELDIQQVIHGGVFNMGFQFDFAENLLRVWNRTVKAWISTGKPCPRWTPGKWMRIVGETHRDDAAVYHDSLTLNGVNLPIGMSFPVANLGLSDMLNVAIQLDSNKAGAPYTLYVDAVRFTASTALVGKKAA